MLLFDLHLTQMSISFKTVTEVTCAKYFIKKSRRVTILLFVCKALKNKIGIILHIFYMLSFPR